MKKVKLFFISTALLLITISVFASRKTFTNDSLYASTISPVSVYYQLTNSGGWVDIANFGNNAVTIDDSHGIKFNLVAPNVGGIYTQVYSVGW